MANAFLSPSTITKEAIRVLENNLVFTKNVNRKYENEFTGERKVGDTINIRKPAKYTVRDGKVVQLNDFGESTVPLKVDQMKGIDIAFDSAELALDLDSFSKQFIAPAMVRLAQEIDAVGVQQFQNIPNAVGTPGATVFDLELFLDAGVKLDNESTPDDGRRGAILSPRQQAKAVSNLKELFNSSKEISYQYEKGRMGTAANFDFAMSQNVPTHTVGPQGGTPLVNGAAQTGTSLATDGWTAAAALRLNKGDIFTIAGVNAVNPVSGEDTGELRQFTVTAAFSSTGTGTGNISIYPAIVATGKDRTVSALPADNAAITVMGAPGTKTQIGLAYHPDAFTMAFVDLPLPKGMDMAERMASKKLGISLRFIRGYDVMTDTWVSRFDVLFGFATVSPEMAVRIQS